MGEGRWAVLCLLLLGGCDDMIQQRKVLPQARPAAGRAAGVVAFREQAEVVPALDAALLERGQQRYRIACVPCHGEAGDGHGMVVQRGFPAPPSYHIERLRAAPTRHFYDVITNGYGAMYSFAERVVPRDRWAIAAYIRALQAGERVAATELGPDERAGLR